MKTKPSDLNVLRQEGEGTTLEFKESLPASLARDLVGMANTLGGKILLGVRDDGTIAGLTDSNNLRARIQDIARNCDPPVHVVVEAVGRVMVVHVRESDGKPVQCSEGFFCRQGATTQKLKRDEVRELFHREGSVRFDLAPCPKFRYPQDFDREKYARWLRLSGITGRPRTEDVLVNIEAAEHAGGKLLFRNAGVLFFAKNVRHFFNQAYITCLLAKGTDKVHVLDRKDFDGCIVADIEDAIRFVERNTRTAWRIEALQRENIPEYPMKALREAITNAVMHRDWSMDGANVFVELYTDRIEVSSPGGLPKGMKLADLGHKSIRRNALLADLLHRIEFIEKAGTGVKRIRDEARAQGCPEPKFEETGFITVTFYPNPEVRAQAEAQGEAGQQRPRKYPASTPQVTVDVTGEGVTQSPTQVTPQVTGEVTSEVAGEVTGEVTGEVVRLLEAIQQRVLSRSDVQTRLGLVGQANFRDRYLAPALDAGLIEMTIPDKPNSRLQRYRLTQAGRDYLKKLKAN